MKRILQVYPQLNNAGTEMVIMNWYKNISREKIQFDFLVQKSGELDETVRKMGANIYYIENKDDYNKKLIDFFKGHKEFNVVHTHTHKEMGTVLKAAKKAGVKYRIAHSHNSRTDLPTIFKLYKMLSERKTEKSATHFFACSEEAAKWLFPTKYKQCRVINNAIDLDRFIFNPIKRKSMRKALNISEASKVICHVGRFAEQKNHERIIEILNELTESDKSIYALLVGVGPLYEKIKSKAKSERIIFMGNRTDVPDIISASDLFLFPSLYEGLGIVAIEAQAGGIKCIASTGVPKAADIGTGLFEQLSLNEDNSVWIEHIKSCLEKCDLEERERLSKKSYESNYNIKKVAKEIENFYTELN